MNHSRTTLIFLGVALLAIVVGWEPWARSTPTTLEPEVDRSLLPKFTDSLAATSMDVVKYDEDQAAIGQFQVAKVGGLWVIPSHQNYPADAQQHMAQAATALREVKVLGVASTAKGDHELYGVVNPDPATIKPGQTGVGLRVTLRDAKKDVLADVVIGKEVKEQPGLRYVRHVTNDRVYRVKLSPDSFSTRFGDWIEKNLLKLNAFDIRQVFLNDYTSQPLQGGRMGILKRSEIKLAFDDEKSAWNAIDLVSFEKNQPQSDKLADDEELNSEKLNALKTALGDLEIVDVERKPKGIDVDLQVNEEFLDKNQETLQSLFERGFFPLAGASGDKLDFLSREGEVVCTLKDGVEYVLRFGMPVAAAASQEKKPVDSKEPTGDAKSGSRTNRYLFLTARYNDQIIPKPKLEPLPGEKPAEEKPTEEKPAEPKKTEGEGKADDNADADKTPADEAKPAEEPKAADAAAAPKSSEELGKEQAKDAATETKEDKASAKKDEARPAEKKDEAKPPAKKPEDKAAEDAKRALIEQENKRKQEDYDRQVKESQKKVKDLNERFADWYYLISDDVYQKIHLGRDGVVKKKEKSDDKKDATGEKQDATGEKTDAGKADADKADGPAALKKIEEQGLNKE